MKLGEMMKQKASYKDDDHLSELISTYSKSLRKIAWRYIKDHHLAEDIVQEVFITYITHHDRIREDCSIRTWLYKVTENKCKDYLRTNYYRNVTPANDFLFIYQMTPESEIIDQQTKEELLHHIYYLPKKYQEILYLFYVKELKLKEVEQHLNMNLSTVKTRLLRGKCLLKISMKGI
ncbi:sigma-70 family RNA polymerase sigma factor [Metabacillus idriensis]|uniref:RNA polymerase sigma factor n=1 Tax=Metabacillus idriensis TaxID=324768 RepID=UPI0009153654|nr:sigma-70 family RNA polymerase sigma factor [Metabacillus idriensis]MCM3598113.1 sigma-70 family RNA polymerase sigma factor [Metabacillus idriensis]OHR73780.1 hypothetical protein HMPREF3291_18230 [Bacillus sp. HMSC76G11]